jgi:hypothetical protein
LVTGRPFTNWPIAYHAPRLKYNAPHDQAPSDSILVLADHAYHLRLTRTYRRNADGTHPAATRDTHADADDHVNSN